jgi:GNAT superfamily N-acetyltransferase
VGRDSSPSGSGEPETAPAVTAMAAYQPDHRPATSALEFEIRPVRRADCSAVGRIEAAREGSDVAAAVARCEEQIQADDVMLLVAVASGGVVGFARAARWRHPPDPGPSALPQGWYLLGVVVVDAWRRRGIGRALTERRLDWIAERASAAYYFTNARNRPSLDLHAELGFVELTTDFTAPGVSFDGGEGVLCRADLRRRLAASG